MVVSLSKLNMSTNIIKIFGFFFFERKFLVFIPLFLSSCALCVRIYLITDLFIYRKRFWLIYDIINLCLSWLFLLPVGNSLLIFHLFMFCTIKLLVL